MVRAKIITVIVVVIGIVMVIVIVNRLQSPLKAREYQGTSASAAARERQDGERSKPVPGLALRAQDLGLVGSGIQDFWGLGFIMGLEVGAA